MPQVTLYLDDELDGKVRAAAAAAGVSYGSWIVDVIRSSTGNKWPAHIRALAGSLRDFPLEREMRLASSTWSDDRGLQTRP